MRGLILLGLSVVGCASGCAKAAPAIKNAVVGGEKAAFRSAAPAVHQKPDYHIADIAEHGYDQYKKDGDKKRR